MYTEETNELQVLCRELKAAHLAEIEYLRSELEALRSELEVEREQRERLEAKFLGLVDDCVSAQIPNAWKRGLL